MLRDPRNLGTTGFRQVGPEKGEGSVDLGKLRGEEWPEGLLVEGRVKLLVDDRVVRVEGPAVGKVEVLLDGEVLPSRDGARFLLPPAPPGSARLGLRFRGKAAAVTGLWAIP